VLEKIISKASVYTLFEFNDTFTRSQFVAMVEPFLTLVKARQGVYDFSVICDETNNPPDVVDAGQFVGDIYIKPSRSINFIRLNFVAVRNGVEFSEVVGNR
jgi:phage tail sheath protein FI